MSGYAILAQAWGAEVSGWDRKETPYLEGVRAAGIPVEVSEGPPSPPADADGFVSTAFAGRGCRGFGFGGFARPGRGRERGRSTRRARRAGGLDRGCRGAWKDDHDC